MENNRKKEQPIEYLIITGQDWTYDSLFWYQCPASLLTCVHEAKEGHSPTLKFLPSLRIQESISSTGSILTTWDRLASISKLNFSYYGEKREKIGLKTRGQNFSSEKHLFCLLKL